VQRQQALAHALRALHGEAGASGIDQIACARRRLLACCVGCIGSMKSGNGGSDDLGIRCPASGLSPGNLIYRKDGCGAQRLPHAVWQRVKYDEIGVASGSVSVLSGADGS
jgi:hypothetical protein